MDERRLFDITGEDIGLEEIGRALEKWLGAFDLAGGKVLILPPDYSRSMSQAGPITVMLYRMLSPICQVDIMPALGTHEAVSAEERLKMYGRYIPDEAFLVHDWRNDVVDIGEVPSEYVREISSGRLDYPIKVQVNRRLMDPSYSLVISVGQVVPHEVVGMANYTKNVLVGCGGKDIIDKTHFLGAVYGLEAMMGKDHSPVRKVFDYAEEHFLKGIPLQYILTVVEAADGLPKIKGVFAGRRRAQFEKAVELSVKANLNLLDEPLRKVVVYLDPEHYKSTWIGNKAIYRTRMAIADEGELIIIAPGVRHFGEDGLVDRLIRKYGYRGTDYTLECASKEEDLMESLSAAAHLIHGSSEGRFKIIYCPGKLTKEEIEGVGFAYMDCDEAVAKYDVTKLAPGMNRLDDGEEIFFVSNPTLGLWALKSNYDKTSCN